MRVLMIAAAVGLVAFPALVSDDFYLRMGAEVLLAAVGASAWNILGGYAGQISVGHAMFFGVGAYLPLLMFTKLEWPPITGVPLGVAISLGIAILIGRPTFRLQGHYFSMATIAVAELIRISIGNWDYVGAATGMMGPAVSRTWLDLSFRSPVPYYYVFLAVLSVVLLLTWYLQRARMGYYWRAIRGGERAARSLGVSVSRYKLYALLLSATFTSVAGSLYALMVGFIDPDSGFGILRSVEMIIIAALGGAGTLFGPLLGAAVLIPLQSVTNTLYGGGGSGLTYILYGGIIVLLARFEPGGMMQLSRRGAVGVRRLLRMKARPHAA